MKKKLLLLTLVIASVFTMAHTIFLPLIAKAEQVIIYLPLIFQ